MSAERSAPPSQTPDSGYYDRDAVVASITRYYELLSRMVAIKPNHIGYAPPGGRQDDVIPLKQLRLLGFTETMIDLVRHVPFVHSVDRPVYQGTQTIYYNKYSFAQYPDERYLPDDPHWAEMWPLPEEKIPHGIVPLSRPLQGAPDGVWWLLDTNNGELTAHSAWIERPTEEVPEDEQWRTTRPVPATAYFDGLYHDLILLNMLPVPLNVGLHVWEIWPAHGHRDGFQTWADEARQAYLQCHWPDLQKFQRAKCRRLLVGVQERQRAWQREKYSSRPPPADSTDAPGEPGCSPVDS